MAAPRVCAPTGLGLIDCCIIIKCLIMFLLNSSKLCEHSRQFDVVL